MAHTKTAKKARRSTAASVHLSVHALEESHGSFKDYAIVVVGNDEVAPSELESNGLSAPSHAWEAEGVGLGLRAARSWTSKHQMRIIEVVYWPFSPHRCRLFHLPADDSHVEVWDRTSEPATSLPEGRVVFECTHVVAAIVQEELNAQGKAMGRTTRFPSWTLHTAM